MPSLSVDGARTRAAALSVQSYDVDLDLTQGDRTFASTSTIRFTASAPASWVDVKPDELLSVTLNGAPVDVAGLTDGRLELTGLQAENELVVVATMLYTHDGEGIHRAVDAADGLAYTYAMSFLDAAPRIFACFDQPDLKAPYRVKVTAPTEWLVLGNGAATQVSPGRWELAETKPLSTYFVTIVAGPYHQVTDEHDGIPLSLVAKQSLKAELDREAEDIFRVTKQSFDEYHRLFGYRYPFGEYHQAFVPEFNAGAMENPGCVTFRDPMIFRSAATEGERGVRANTVVHEMAHQWFGDTVTMKWWNDLWLNESFAEYMAHRVSMAVTEYQNNWTDFGFIRKWWGLQADQRSSTHPVAADPVKDALDSLNDFDGISYAKGAAALKQLAAYLGDDVFLAGVNAHIRANEFGNATFGDLLAKWTEAGAVDIDAWAQAWLRTPGVDTISAVRTADGIKLRRVAPAAYPAARPHQLSVGGYDADGRATIVDVRLDADEVDVPLDPSVAVVIPDAGDDTWAKVRLDADSLANLTAVLPKIDTSVTRAVILNSVRDAVADAELDPRLGFDILLAMLAVESTDIGVTTMAQWAETHVLGGYLPYEENRARIEQVLGDRLSTVAAGTSLQLAVVRAYARFSADAGVLRGWLAGSDVPAGVTMDDELRWKVVLQLARIGAIGEAEIAAEYERDSSSAGQVHATRCRAALPDAAAKEAAWATIMADPEVANYDLEAACDGFWHPAQLELTAPYVDRYFAEVAGVAKLREGWIVATTALLAFPRYSIDEQVVARGRDIAADEGVASGIRRSVGDRADDIGRAVAVRAAYQG
ncbi:aminopeptidase N [Kribbella sandramycini]|uniref:Aminopeptidase N n=1 Tax=Kribbella sandramycini TaxID=60450 RepID=A0A7Y4KZK8_9ACTN|nr:aminopeptidase N [Kribbella sandramycini]MBB6569319.1 aminopeptidase N [Kribbella sandramycini]NOL40842.1 aminopeptidase N [Kribbella sandramycini]